MEHARPEFPGAFALQTDLPVDPDVAAAFAAARAAPGAVLFGPDCDLKIPGLAADRFAVRSQMAMAIDAKADKPYLFGLHQCSRVRAWTAEEQRLFQEIGRRLSDAISALSFLRSLRDSERKLDAAQRIAHVGWWERDFVTNRVALSEEVQRIFGVPPVDLPLWQDRWTSLIHPQDRARTSEAAAAAVRGGPRYDVEYRVVRPDGTVRVVHSQGDVVWDDSGRPLRQFGVMQDITELRQSEDELSEIKERFRVLAESSLTGIYLTEQDRFRYVNPALAKMFGYEVEEVVGRLGSVDLTCPDDRPLVAENMRRRLQGDVEGMRYEFRGLRKDGSVFPVEVHGRRIEHGGRIGVLGTLIDISERKRAEESLRESEAYLTEAQRLSHAGSWALDVASNRYLYTSEEFDRIFGFDPDGEELTTEAVLERMHPEDRLSWRQILQKSVRERLDTASQYRIVLPDGSIRHIHTIRHPVLNSAGEVVKLVGTSIDVTERKRAEEELRVSEARFRTFVDHARDGFFLMNEQLTVVDVNRQACESLGYRREELIGMHPRAFDARLDDPAIAGLAQRAGAGETLTFETVHRRKDGTEFPVEIRSGHFEQGGQPFYLALVRDISERKRVEAELRARQEMLDLAQKAARALAFDWYIGARESENRWSPELEAMYGLEPGAFDGTYQGWKKLVHPEDWPAVKLAIQRAHESGDIAAEYRVIHKDGSVHWLRAKGRMFFDAQGQAERMVGFMLDITDQRNAEEEVRMTDARFRTLVDLAPDAFMLHGQDGTVVDVNRQACEALGYPREELIGMKPVEFDVGLDLEALQRVTARIAAGETVTVESRHRRKDGSVFPVEVRGRQLPQGESWIGVSLSRDITERKRVEQERERLRQLEADLAHMSRIITMGELTASIAHEVNQPLGAMVANAAACERWLAARRPETEKVRRVLKSIAADGQRASAVIGRIRALMKRQAPRKEPVDLGEAIREVLALTQQELQRHAIVLATRFDEHMPPVRADKVQLQQVLLNLVMNAIEAMSAIDDRPRELTIVSAQEGPDSVLVEVRDSGPGLDAGQAERLFEAFYTTKEEGMGIGLAISRSIVEAHGGHLSAAPNAPHGTVFRFSLPAGA
jgi:PAS domain S-box-containing protein